MFLQQLQKQLIRDLKASWKKTVTLGLLLVVGLFCWIPPLLKSGSKVPPASSATPAGIPAAIPLPLGVLKKQSETETSKKPSISWKEIEKELEEDKLWQSAEIAAIPGRPFEIDYDQFSPPVLFEKDGDFSDQKLTFKTPTTESATSPGQLNVSTQSTTTTALNDELALTTTLIGSQRKLATINGKFYSEGDSFVHQGTEYSLTAIQHKSVLLRANGDVVVLKLRNSPAESETESPVISPAPENSVIRIPLP